METFEFAEKSDLEQLIFIREESVDLKAVIAIHNSVLGPAVGGVRMMEYANEDEVLQDAGDLAREMALRAILAGADLGGASAILIGNPKIKSEAYFRAFGRFVQRLAGQFLAVMEVGTDFWDLRNIKRETDYVLALPKCFGGIADAMETTASGVLYGIGATAKFLFGTNSLENLTFLVQGVGRIGNSIVRELVKSKAKIIVTDKNYDKIKGIQDEFPEIKMIRPDEVANTKADILVPCSLGRLVDSKNVGRFRVKGIAGGGSNVIPDLETGDQLAKRGILYVPHFVINSGELIQADYELKGLSAELLQKAIQEIYPRTLNLLERAKEDKEAPVRTALKVACDRMEKITNIGRRRKL